jgi:ABC-2 type transport system ATP-binding protein
MRLMYATAGSARLCGVDVDDVAMHARIGYLPEQPYFYDYLTARELVEYCGELFGLGCAQRRARAAELLERVRLDRGAWDRQLRRFSKGMLQRVGLAQALVNDPELVVLDEPMSGLDPVGTDLMRETLLELRRSGATIVLSSHQMETVERLCDRVALIDRGEKVLDGAVPEVKARFGRNSVALAFEGDGAFIEALPFVAGVSDFGQYLEVRLADGADAQALLQAAAARLRVRRFEVVEPSLHDIFVREVTARGEAPSAEEVA